LPAFDSAADHKNLRKGGLTGEVELRKAFSSKLQDRWRQIS